MSRIVLDTSAYSAFFRGHPGVKAALQEADEILLPAIALGELLAGFRNGGRARQNRRELEAFLSTPRVAVVGIDAETAERYGTIQDHLRRSGTPIPTNDLWIAACGMQHGARIVATDAHYLKVPQVMVDLYAI